jgi:hypothetical protein
VLRRAKEYSTPAEHAHHSSKELALSTKMAALSALGCQSGVRDSSGTDSADGHAAPDCARRIALIVRTASSS